MISLSIPLIAEFFLTRNVEIRTIGMGWHHISHKIEKGYSRHLLNKTNYCLPFYIDNYPFYKFVCGKLKQVKVNKAF